MGPSVIIAEDEALIRLDLRESLIDEGYTVAAEAKDGAELLELVNEHNPDVVLVDIKMPNVDGLTAARQIVDNRICAVVILTAFSQRDLIHQARDIGVSSYLVKPFQREELVPAIELAIARFSELSEANEQIRDLSNKLETRKLLDRAKGQLMDNYQLSESDAFRFLQKTAMSRRASISSIAELVLADELGPT